MSAPAAPASSDRLYPARPIAAVSVAVFRGGKVLVARRGRAPFKGAWSLPGGVVELGETLHAAARRELAEELGVKAEIVGFTDHLESIARDSGGVRRHFIIASFFAKWTSGEAVGGEEAADPRWIAPGEAAALKTTPGLLALLQKAERALQAAS